MAYKIGKKLTEYINIDELQYHYFDILLRWINFPFKLDNIDIFEQPET